MPIILSIIAFSFEGSPIWLYLSLIMFMGLGGDIVILYYGKLKCNISPRLFLLNVFFPVLGISAVMIAFGIIFDYILPYQNVFSLVVCGIMTTIGLIISMFTFGLTFSEKLIIQSLIAAFSKRFH